MEKNRVILCVDDDADDRELLAIQLKRVDNLIAINEVDDGVHALAYLSAAKQNGELPCLIVLDLNMPRLDGRRTFEKIKEDNLLKNIPVVVYTSSQNPNDANFFNTKGVEFISKPMTPRLLPDIARTMVNYCCKSSGESS